MKTTYCEHCGAITGSEASWTDIIGQYHAKRAIEVAMVEDLPIGFIGEEEALVVAQAASKLLHTVHYVTAREKLPLSCSIIIEVKPTGHVVENLNEKTEALETVKTRVNAATRMNKEPEAIEPAALDLLKLAERHMEFTRSDIVKTIAVANCIRRLAGEKRIEPVHIAEAIQYSNKKIK